MRKNVRRVFTGAGLLILVLGFAVWWALNMFSITVINHSGRMLNRIEARLGGKILRMRPLADGAHKTIYGIAGPDEKTGAWDEYGVISFELAGKNYRRETEYLARYIPMSAQDCTLTVDHVSTGKATLACTVSTLSRILLLRPSDMTIDDGRRVYIR